MYYVNLVSTRKTIQIIKQEDASAISADWKDYSVFQSVNPSVSISSACY